MKAVSLFAGAGGACQGLRDAGLEVVASFERNADAVATLRANGLNGVLCDLNDYDFTTLADEGIELVEGGPPCQPFSAAGRGHGEWDDRDCIPTFIDAVWMLHPRVFVMENVRGLTYKKHREYLERVLKSFEALGYDAEWRVLNAADFGVPQTRQRLFIVGRCDGLAVRWPEPTHAKGGEGGLLPWVTMADALGWGITDRPSMTVMSGGTETGGPEPLCHPKRIREQAEARNAWKVNTGRDWKPGGTRADAQRVPVTEPSPAIDTKGRWWLERPATTVAAAASGRIGRPGHKDWDKGEAQFQSGAVKVTPEETAILQDFPREWKFVGNRTSLFRQIGNACPRSLTTAVVRAQLEAMGQ